MSSAALPDIASLAALFPPDKRGPEYGIAYVYTGVSLLAFGEEKWVPELWQKIADAHAGDDAAQVTAATRLREGLVKASPLAGFPRAINALTSLSAIISETSPTVSAALASTSSPDDTNNNRHPSPLNNSTPNGTITNKSNNAAPTKLTHQQRGADLFATIYGQHAARVRQNLDGISGGLLGGFAVGCIYGELLAETRVLSAKESAALVFVACVAAGAGPQAKGHMYGARNLGNEGREISGAVELVRRLAEAVGVRLSLEGMEFVEKARAW